MSIDVKLLVKCSCLFLIAALLVVLVRVTSPKPSPQIVKKALPGSETFGRLPAGLILQADPRVLLLVLPTCDTKDYQDRFLLHVYTEATRTTRAEGFVNMDFYLSREKGKEKLYDGEMKCIFEKKLDQLAVEAITIGQFKASNDKCCLVTWTQSFSFDITQKKLQ